MYQELLEKNKEHIQNQKTYRSYNSKVSEVVNVLNSRKIVTVSGLRHTGKTKLVYTVLKKTNSFENCFYYNSDLDTLWTINSQEELIILFDIFVRIYGVPKIIILQNTNNITGIKEFIQKLYKTKKYNILVVGNNIKIQGIPDIEVFPIWLSNSLEESYYWGVPEVRIIPDLHYKDFLLEVLKHDIISKDILEAYNIKNISLFYKVMWYIALEPGYTSLRNMQRNLTGHHIEISLLTLIDYVNAALNTKLLSKCSRYDIKNDNTISSQVRYFFWDVWIRRSFSRNEDDLKENLIYIELLRKWYSISWWLNGKFQFAFYAVKWNKKISIALENSQDKNEVRKTARKLSKIWDNSKKLVIVKNKNSLKMRKFEEQEASIINIRELTKLI